MPDKKTHWESIYQSKSASEVSWYQPHLKTSLELLTQAGVDKKAHIIDVGGGASTFADDLLDKQYTNISVLDISSTALEVSKKRLGSRAKQVHWIEGDITAVQLPVNQYDLWHDRAVFHFLTESESRTQYMKTLHGSLKPGGKIILATFSLKGPERCSNLNIVRYSSELLQAELGQGYHLLRSVEETHSTPFNTTQAFVYCLFQKV